MASATEGGADGPVGMVRLRRATPADGAAVLDLLRSHAGLEVGFEADEVWVAVDGGGALVACARLRRHPDGALELASVATRSDLHGKGIASSLVRSALGEVREAVFALALAPGFFARHGFREVDRSTLPASVRAKADGLCASQPYVAMAR